jgi:hypothetical protein
LLPKRKKPTPKNNQINRLTCSGINQERYEKVKKMASANSYCRTDKLHDLEERQHGRGILEKKEI